MYHVHHWGSDADSTNPGELEIMLASEHEKLHHAQGKFQPISKKPAKLPAGTYFGNKAVRNKVQLQRTPDRGSVIQFKGRGIR